MQKTTAPKQMKMLCAVRNFFSLSSSQARPLHYRGLLALSGATMVVMRRISAKSSHLAFLFVNFLLTIFFQFFPKCWVLRSVHQEFSSYALQNKWTARGRPRQAEFPIGPPHMEFFSIESEMRSVPVFSRKPGHMLQERVSSEFATIFWIKC